MSIFATLSCLYICRYVQLFASSSCLLTFPSSSFNICILVSTHTRADTPNSSTPPSSSRSARPSRRRSARRSSSAPCTFSSRSRTCRSPTSRLATSLPPPSSPSRSRSRTPSAPNSSSTRYAYISATRDPLFHFALSIAPQWSESLAYNSRTLCICVCHLTLTNPMRFVCLLVVVVAYTGRTRRQVRGHQGARRGRERAAHRQCARQESGLSRTAPTRCVRVTSTSIP